MGSNILGSIYTTTISSEKYIVISSQNIELSGNVIIKEHVTISNGLLNTNSLIPNVPNSASLGSTGNNWSNAYINDVSINNNLQVTGNVYISGNLEFQNVYTIGEFDNSYANVYTSDHIDNSFQNVYNIEYIDNSFQNVYTRGHIDQSFANVYTIGQFDNSFANVYTRGHIDQSFANIYTRIQVDNSFVTKRVVELSLNALPTSSGGGSSSSIVLTSISNDLVPLTTNTYDLGSTTKFWNNAYINNLRASNRVYQDINSGPLYEINSTVQTWEWHRTNALTVPGRSLASISNVEQNEKVRLMVSRDTWLGGKRKVYNTNDKTSSTWEWSNGTLWTYYNWDTNEPGSLEDNVKIQTTGFWHDYYNNPPWTTERGPAVYMSYGGNDISWNAVNGYYGLAKDAYPSLNPSSSGALAVSTWTVGEGANYFKSYWSGICWSPELMLFVAVATSDATGTNRVMTSINGKNWTVRTAGVEVNSWSSICWSPQLRLFVAVASSGSNNRVMTSSDGITWIARPGAPQPHTWTDVCWSPELGLFVAVAYNRYNSVMTSVNGITWINILDENNNLFFYQWNSVCWTPELKLFVAVGLGRVMISQNGINWTEISLPSGLNNNNWTGVAWSGELGIFVAVANSGSNRVMTSPDGVNWTARYSLAYTIAWSKVCWSPHLRLFAAIGGWIEAAQFQRLMTSPDGITWTSRTIIGWLWANICWSPELGIFACTTFEGWVKSATSSLKGRPPTSYNVFDSSFNSIDETGKWTFSNMAVTTLNVTGTFTNTSDDRLKHNEVIIANGLDVIDRLNPKFYQKTQTLLDASYNGDLSGQAWTYEAGLIAQELLQIPELTFAVCGGDYYQKSYILKNQSNDISTNYYDMSANYDISTNYINRANYYDTSANYDISYNLIAQPYSLNYTSIYVYVFAAIKELHAKVKAQETAIYNRQAIINNCITRIETLEQRNQV